MKFKQLDRKLKECLSGILKDKYNIDPQETNIPVDTTRENLLYYGFLLKHCQDCPEVINNRNRIHIRGLLLMGKEEHKFYVPEMRSEYGEEPNFDDYFCYALIDFLMDNRDTTLKHVVVVNIYQILDPASQEPLESSVKLTLYQDKVKPKDLIKAANKAMNGVREDI